MVSETIQPLIKELPVNEKRRLLKWLIKEVDSKPITEGNTELRKRLIGHIQKAKTKNP